MRESVVRLRRLARRALGTEQLHTRLDQVEGELRVLRPNAHERSRMRWREAHPDAHLTWGYELSGDAFVTKVSDHGGFSALTRVLEVGPGYGRLLKACLDLGVPFAEYVGLDMSAANVEHLGGRFPDPRIRFVHGEAETAMLDGPFHLLISSLVFKHMHPTWETALGHCAGAMAPGALACFDLIEGDRSVFEADDVTYIKHYSRAEVDVLLDRAGFDRTAFDYVDHDATHRRLLVVARRRGDS